MRRGKPNITRQYTLTSMKRDRTRDKINPEDMPSTKSIWCRDHNGPDTSFGMVYLMYKGVIQLMQPITSPWPSLAITNDTTLGISAKILKSMAQQLRIIKHSLLEYLAIILEQMSAPMAAVKHVDPVSRPWVSARG